MVVGVATFFWLSVRAAGTFGVRYGEGSLSEV